MTDLRVELVTGSVTSELRRAVLRPAWVPGTAMPGDDDPDALHVAAVGSGTVIGTAVLFERPCPHHPDVPHAWQLRGMATAPARQGQGVGGLVLEGAIDIVRQRRGALLWCKARVSAFGFYSAHGFVPDSEEYVEPETGLPHRDMSRPP